MESAETPIAKHALFSRRRGQKLQSGTFFGEKNVVERRNSTPSRKAAKTRGFVKNMLFLASLRLRVLASLR
jgi:hypothetical protein